MVDPHALQQTEDIIFLVRYGPGLHGASGIPMGTFAVAFGGTLHGIGKQVVRLSWLNGSEFFRFHDQKRRQILAEANGDAGSHRSDGRGTRSASPGNSSRETQWNAIDRSTHLDHRSRRETLDASTATALQPPLVVTSHSLVATGVASTREPPKRRPSSHPTSAQSRASTENEIEERQGCQRLFP